MNALLLELTQRPGGLRRFRCVHCRTWVLCCVRPDRRYCSDRCRQNAANRRRP